MTMSSTPIDWTVGSQPSIEKDQVHTGDWHFPLSYTQWIHQLQSTFVLEGSIKDMNKYLSQLKDQYYKQQPPRPQDRFLFIYKPSFVRFLTNYSSYLSLYHYGIERKRRIIK